jgi:hypothetical protein
VLQRRIFKTRTFARWSRKARLPDRTLCVAVDEISAGLVDANLGGNVYKKRVPMPGRGKSGGARVLVATRMGERWFFLYGFAKYECATIDDRELAVLQMTADALLQLDLRSLGRTIQAGELTEICHEKEPHSG